MPQLLVIGYGNPLRGDDGLGWTVAAELFRRNDSRDLEVLPCHQLTPELASAISAVEAVLFVDCAREGEPGTFRCEEVQAKAEIASFTHHMSPASLLALTCELFGTCPKAYLLSICGECFEPGETLSPAVEGRLPELKNALSELIHQHLACFSSR